MMIKILSTLFFSKFIFIFCRIYAILLTIPIIENFLNTKITKLFFSILISMLINLWIPIKHFQLFYIDFIVITIKQVIIGCVIGFSIQLIFSFILITGEIVGLQTGLSLFNFLNFFFNSNNSILSSFFNVLILLIFLSYHGYLYIIDFIFRSFIFFPIDNLTLNTHFLFLCLQMAKVVFIYGVCLSLPMIIICFVLNITMGILNRLFSSITLFPIIFVIHFLANIILLIISYDIFIFYIKWILNSLLLKPFL